MKKISILLFVFTIALVGCKKEEIKRDLVGEWHYIDDGTQVSPNGATMWGFIFTQDNSVKSLYLTIDGSYLSNSTGSWKLLKYNKVEFDFGNNMYPASGTRDISFENDGFVLVIDSYRYKMVENGD